MIDRGGIFVQSTHEDQLSRETGVLAVHHRFWQRMGMESSNAKSKVLRLVDTISTRDVLALMVGMVTAYLLGI